MDEQLNDMPREHWRSTRKSFGFPASKDVGTVANMVRLLREKAAAFVGEPITAAAISIPYLAALYGEDLADAFEYLGLVYLEFVNRFHLWHNHDSASTLAGNGLFLCPDYKNKTACQQWHNANFTRQFGVYISYTHASLYSSLNELGDPRYSMFEGEYPRTLALHLGYDSRQEEGYWDEVRSILGKPVIESPIPRNFSMVLLSGDAAEEPAFRKVLEEVVDEVINGNQDEPPEVADLDPEYSPAKGLAELAMREIYKRKNRTVVASDL
jgi:hypothetical protein